MAGEWMDEEMEGELVEFWLMVGFGWRPGWSSAGTGERSHTVGPPPHRQIIKTHRAETRVCIFSKEPVSLRGRSEWSADLDDTLLASIRSHWMEFDTI